MWYILPDAFSRRGFMIYLALFLLMATVSQLQPSFAQGNAALPNQLPEIFLPPPVLYHFGNYSNLISDVPMISQPDWDKFIMSPSDRYKLVTYRQGLYGCAHPIDCLSFAGMESGVSPWVISVHIADACRTPGAVVSPHLLGKDLRFEKWLLVQNPKPYQSAADFEKQCLVDQYLDLVGGNNGVCELTVAKFFNDLGIKVVLDEAMPDFENVAESFAHPNSLYIRDRTCIEKIEGSVEQNSQLIFSSSFWQKSEGANPVGGAERSAAYKMMLFILSQGDETGPALTFEKVIQDIKSLEAEEALKVFSLTNKAKELFQIYVTCASQNKIEEFRRVTSAFTLKTQRKNYYSTYQAEEVVFLKNLHELCPSK